MTEVRHQQDFTPAPGPGEQQAGVEAAPVAASRNSTPSAQDDGKHPQQYDLPLLVRPAEGPDLGFIYSSWMHNIRQRDEFSPNRTCFRCGETLRSVDKNWFFAATHALITRLIRRSEVLVACSMRHQDQLYGFVVAEPYHPEKLLHWIYTKDAGRRKGRRVGLGYRRAGVATRLMEAMFPELGEVDIMATWETSSSLRLPPAWRLKVNTHRLCEGSQ